VTVNPRQRCYACCQRSTTPPDFDIWGPDGFAQPLHIDILLYLTAQPLHIDILLYLTAPSLHIDILLYLTAQPLHIDILLYLTAQPLHIDILLYPTNIKKRFSVKQSPN
jgi:hypothetical protein